MQNHCCCLYATKEEQLQIVAPFIKDGVKRHEKLLYIYDARSNLRGIEYLQQMVADFAQFHQKSHLELVSVNEIFLERGKFQIDRMIDYLCAETVKALSQRYAGLRVTSEMAGCLHFLPNLEDLIRYEVELNRSIPRKCAILCQYDRQVFTRNQLIDLIPLHSQIIADTQITFNLISEVSSELLGLCVSKCVT